MMASASERAANAASAAQDLLANPYIRRVVEDPEIRDNARVAYSAAREAIERIQNSDSPASAILDDRKVQKSIKRAGEAAIQTRALMIAPRRNSHRILRTMMMVSVAAAFTVAFNEGLRNKVLDLLFGAEEEFDYVPTTAPPAPSAQAEPVVEDAGSSNGKAADADADAVADSE